MVQANSTPSTPDSGNTGSVNGNSSVNLDNRDINLLSQSLENLQDITIDGKRIIISVQEDGSAVPKLQLDALATDLALFAEDLNLTLQSSKVNANVVVSCNRFTGKLNVSGSDGTEAAATNVDSSKTSQAGGDGGTGGYVALYVESADPDSSINSVIARGGKGGAGQDGVVSSTGTNGANGGNGGDGGQVVIFAGSLALQFLNRLKKIYKLSPFKTMEPELRTFIEDLDLSSVQAFKDFSDSLETDIDAVGPPDYSIQNLQNSMDDVADSLNRMVIDYENNLERLVINVAGGDYGVYGAGKTNGNDGQSGKPGNLEVVSFGTPDELVSKATQSNLFFWVHPSQCSRLLEKIKLIYWTLDPNAYHETDNSPKPEKASQPDPVTEYQAFRRDQLLDLLLRLQARTKPFNDADDTAPLVDFYKHHETEFGAINAVPQLQSIYDQASNYLTQLQLKKDVFGRDPDEVPLASYQFYNDLLTNQITNFKALEVDYNNYFAQLKDNNAARKQIASIRQTQTQLSKTASDQLNELKIDAGSAATLIDSYQTILPPLLADLNRQFDTFRAQLNKFQLNFDQLFSSLTSVAFETKPGMATVQATEFIYDGINNVVNDDGQKINKNYLLKQVKTLTGDFSLDEIQKSYTTLNDGTINLDDNAHPTTAMLIADEKKITAILDNFYEKFQGIDDAKKALQNYIAQKQQQNLQILTYNAAVLLIAQKSKIINDAKTQLAALDDKRLDGLQRLDLPDLVSFVSSQYYMARSQVMETISLTERAYRFWSLKESGPLFEATSPSAIDSTTLDAVQKTFLNAYKMAIEGMGSDSTPFPTDPRNQGILIDVPKEQVDSLIKSKNMAVTIPVVLKPTEQSASAAHASQPAPNTAAKNNNPLLSWLGGLFKRRTASPNTATQISDAFALLANVRVSRVRVWLEGAKITSEADDDQWIEIGITHSGHEKIVDQAGNLFSFSHAPVNKLFRYRDNHKTKTREISGDGNFGVENISLDTTNHVYAALGPFTTWNIIIDTENANKHLDLSSLTGVKMEFHGTYYAFN